MGRSGGKNKFGYANGDGINLGADFDRVIETIEIGQAKLVLGPMGRPTYIRRLPDGTITFAYWTIFGYKNGSV